MVISLRMSHENKFLTIARLQPQPKKNGGSEITLDPNTFHITMPPIEAMAKRDTSPRIPFRPDLEAKEVRDSWKINNAQVELHNRRHINLLAEIEDEQHRLIEDFANKTRAVRQKLTVLFRRSK